MTTIRCANWEVSPGMCSETCSLIVRAGLNGRQIKSRAMDLAGWLWLTWMRDGAKHRARFCSARCLIDWIARGEINQEAGGVHVGVQP